VWAIFNAYESDLPYLNVGDLIGYTINALPGQVFTGRVEFISPIVDSESRTAKVRMETDNKNLKLKPGMLANALIHNAKISGEAIILPKSAVLWTGERSVVYTVKKQENGALNFHLREVELGPALGDSVVVISGIHEKELVAVSGVFAVDASAQLAGKNSMMNLSPNPPGDTMSKISNLAAIALICTSAVACDEHKAHAAAQPAKTQNAEGIIQLGVAGSCEMCKMRIEGVAKSQSGVKSADWDIKTQTLRIEIEPSKANLNDISKAIAAAGHDTEKDKADDTTYNALPGCCKYRK
jgi:Cu(I)/Ag(I) efflux system membrane fusion protein